MKPPNYAVDYSVLQVKQMIQRSEQRAHTLNPGAMGHAFSRHGGVTDSDLQARSATMTGKNQDASAFMDDPRRVNGIAGFDDSGNLASNDYWVSLKPFDQAFIIANVLNSRFGQSALGLMNYTLWPRLTISALPFTDAAQRPLTPPMTLMNFTMRVSTSGQPANRAAIIGRLTIIVEPGGTQDGYPELHFVTAFPSQAKLHGTFGMLPGVTRQVSYGGTLAGSQKNFKWDSVDQNSQNAALKAI
jgi:hypothetical protein